MKMVTQRLQKVNDNITTNRDSGDMVVLFEQNSIGQHVLGVPHFL